VHITALLHLAIGPLELVSSARPEAPRQGFNARFVMVLHGDCGACFAALSRGEGALWLNATLPEALQKLSQEHREVIVGSPRGVSPRGSHGTERDSLPSFRSSHPVHRYARIHTQWAKSSGSLSVSPRHQALNRFHVRSRLYFLRAHRIRQVLMRSRRGYISDLVNAPVAVGTALIATRSRT
jgi:hypothetical protein